MSHKEANVQWFVMDKGPSSAKQNNQRGAAARTRSNNLDPPNRRRAGRFTWIAHSWAHDHALFADITANKTIP